MRFTSLSRTLSKQLSQTTRQSLALTLEAGAAVVAYELYPLGIIPKTVPTLPRLWADKAQTEIPVLFVHGVFHNPATFACVKQRLTWAGWNRFHEVNLLHSLRSLPVNAEKISKLVDDLCARYGVPHVDIVAHSMGGILARYYVQRLGGDGKVRHLITLGTPHQGTPLSRYSVFPYLRELAPESRTMKLLKKSPIPKHTQIVAIRGQLDVFTRTNNAGFWCGVRNIELSGVGHAGLLFSRRVGQIITSHLADLR